MREGAKMICTASTKKDSKTTSETAKEIAIIESWNEEAEKTGTTDTYTGKRAWLRTTWNAPVIIKLTSGKNAGELIHAKAKDVSLGGIGIISRNDIPMHTAIEIWVGNHQQGVPGRVMHSTRTMVGFIIGVAFNTPAGNQLKRAAG